MDKFIIITLVVTALCAALVLFRIEARQKRTNVLKPSSYKFGPLGMVVYIVVYSLLTVVEKVCFTFGKTPPRQQEDIQEERAYTDWCFFSTGEFFPDIRDWDKSNWPD